MKFKNKQIGLEPHGVRVCSRSRLLIDVEEIICAQLVRLHADQGLADSLCFRYELVSFFEEIQVALVSEKFIMPFFKPCTGMIDLDRSGGSCSVLLLYNDPDPSR